MNAELLKLLNDSRSRLSILAAHVDGVFVHPNYKKALAKLDEAINKVMTEMRKGAVAAGTAVEGAEEETEEML